MKKQSKHIVDCIGGSARLARAQIGEAKHAINSGDLIRAELELHEAEGLLGVPETTAEMRVSLELRLQGATIAQYRGNFIGAGEMAMGAVEFADRQFGPRGLEIGMAQLHHNFALEAHRDFYRALRRNLELDDELVSVPGSPALRLNCLTRAIACAVKNADRATLPSIGLRSDPLLLMMIRNQQHPRVVAWHFFWCAVAALRQNRFEEANRLLEFGRALAGPVWRFKNASDFVEGYGLTLERRTKPLGIEKMTIARRDAEERGFHGHLHSIDAGFSGQRPRGS